MKTALFTLFIFISLGAAVLYFLNEPLQNERTSDSFEDARQEFYIDYGKLKENAKNHPKSEELLARIKEREQMLYDGNQDNDREAYEGIAFDMRQLGDYEGAIRGYWASIAVYEDNAISYRNLATSYKETGQYEKAEAAYKKTIELDLRDTSSYRNLADFYLYSMPDKKGKITSVMGEGLKRLPNHPDLLSYLAVFYQNEGEKEKAIEYYKKLLEVSPANESARSELNKLLR